MRELFTMYIGSGSLASDCVYIIQPFATIHNVNTALARSRWCEKMQKGNTKITDFYLLLISLHDETNREKVWNLKIQLFPLITERMQ